MKKKIIVLVIITLITTIGIILINQKQEEKTSDNISIILSSDSGNTTTDKFPDKDSYEYEKVECDNSLGEATPTFNEETWKLNVTVNGEKIDGNFKCNIYFKEKAPTATETIIAKYSADNTEGLIKVDQSATDQMKATTEYRYSGSDVNNYVNFNNETWRIIGVFDVDDGTGNYESRVKLMRDQSLGDYSWDTSSSDINGGAGINQWGESEDASGNAYTGADLKTLLNTTYYNRTTSDTCYNGEANASTSCDFSASGLNETARSMIDDAKWYTGGITSTEITPPTAYIEERGNTLPPTGIELPDSYNDTIIRTKSWIGKIAQIYPSDYGYASKECYNLGVTLGYDYDESICINSNWLYSEYRYYTMSPLISDSNSVLRVGDGGDIGSNGVYRNRSVRPVVYLKSSVKITGGTGENAENAYQLSL